jgi:hypothetical protein
VNASRVYLAGRLQGAGLVTHVVVDGIGVCGAEGFLNAAPRPAVASCALCKAVLLYVGAPASSLLEDEWLCGSARNPEAEGRAE